MYGNSYSITTSLFTVVQITISNVMSFSVTNVPLKSLNYNAIQSLPVILGAPGLFMGFLLPRIENTLNLFYHWKVIASFLVISR